MTLANRTTTLPPALIGADIAQDTLTQDEYEAFKATLPSWRDRLICMLLRNTGLRANELLKLTSAECSLEGPSYVVYIRRSKKKQTVYEALYVYLGLGVQLRDYIKGNNYTLTEPIFGGGDNRRDSRKITQRGLRFIFDKTGREVIGRPISPKAFRSFFVPDDGGRERAHGNGVKDGGARRHPHDPKPPLQPVGGPAKDNWGGDSGLIERT